MADVAWSSFGIVVIALANAALYSRTPASKAGPDAHLLVRASGSCVMCEFDVNPGRASTRAAGGQLVRITSAATILPPRTVTVPV